MSPLDDRCLDFSFVREQITQTQADGGVVGMGFQKATNQALGAGQITRTASFGRFAHDRAAILRLKHCRTQKQHEEKVRGTPQGCSASG